MEELEDIVKRFRTEDQAVSDAYSAESPAHDLGVRGASTRGLGPHAEGVE